MISNDKVTEILNTHLQQRTYYLLAVAAACIGFTIVTTQNSKLDWSLIPAGVSVLCWFGSFLCGTGNINRTIVFFATYKSYYNITEQYPQLHPQEVADLINDQIDSFGKNRYVKWQKYLLFAGAIIFIYWHIQNLYIHTYIHETIKKEITK